MVTLGSCMRMKSDNHGEFFNAIGAVQDMGKQPYFGHKLTEVRITAFLLCVKMHSVNDPELILGNGASFLVLFSMGHA